MSGRAAEFLVLFIVKLGSVLVDKYKHTIKDSESLRAFEEKVELAKSARTRQEKQDAAGKITDSF